MLAHLTIPIAHTVYTADYQGATVAVKRVPKAKICRKAITDMTDEIVMMQGWLRDRDETVPEVDAHHETGFMRMPGMLTEEEMEANWARLG